MKKNFCIFAVVLCLVFAGCSNSSGSNTTAKTYMVTFNADNGSADTTQTVSEGEKAVEPVVPTKANDMAGLFAGTPAYTFTGWYKGDTPWNFAADTVTADIT